MAVPKVAPDPASDVVLQLLDSPEIKRLIADLQATRWTGRPGYPIRTMMGLALTKSFFALPTWTKVVALVADPLEASARPWLRGQPAERLRRLPLR